MGWTGALGRTAAVCLGAAMALWASEGAAAGCRLEKIVELPVTMVGGPLAPAKINGADVRLIVDSGGAYSLISPAAAARLRLPTSYAYTNPMVRGVGGTVDAGIARVATFSLGGQTLRGVEFLVAGNGLGAADGLLGQNILGFADAEYDLANGVVRLWRPIGCGGRSLAYWVKADQPFGEVELELERRTHELGP